MHLQRFKPTCDSLEDIQIRAVGIVKPGGINQDDVVIIREPNSQSGNLARGRMERVTNLTSIIPRLCHDLYELTYVYQSFRDVKKILTAHRAFSSPSRPHNPIALTRVSTKKGSCLKDLDSHNNVIIFVHSFRTHHWGNSLYLPVIKLRTAESNFIFLAEELTVKRRNKVSFGKACIPIGKRCTSCMIELNRCLSLLLSQHKVKPNSVSCEILLTTKSSEHQGSEVKGSALRSRTTKRERSEETMTIPKAKLFCQPRGLNQAIDQWNISIGLFRVLWRRGLSCSISSPSLYLTLVFRDREYQQ